MLQRFCMFVLVAGLVGVAYGSEMPQQVVTSEVFYDYDHQEAKEDFDEEDEYQVMEEEPEVQEVIVEEEKEIPVWPLVGSDADFKISCDEGGCPTNGETKVVTKMGNGLIIENNINTVGIGWSGGPNISNETRTVAGFDYECANNAEMPLLHREMMEDDGGTVLAVSRSSRRMCNRRPDPYIQFTEKVKQKAKEADIEVTESIVAEDVVADGTPVAAKIEKDIKVNDYVDDEAPVSVQNQVRSWVVVSGQTLREVLKSWCDKEGWDLVWATSREYPIEASAIFKGRFVDVASALVRNFERATPIPYAKFYKGNRVLVVSTSEE